VAKIAERKPIVAHAGNGGARVAPAPHVDIRPGPDIARRYRCEFIVCTTSNCTTTVQKIPLPSDVPLQLRALDETEDGRLAMLSPIPAS
jgi:hypothetical protein